MKIESYKDLIVWQKSLTLVKEIYDVTNLFPKEELYVLTSQIRRAAISIPSNIAEGFRCNNLKEYIQFLYIAVSSAAELETQIIIAKDLYQNLDFETAESLCLEVQKMLSTLISRLKSK